MSPGNKCHANLIINASRPQNYQILSNCLQKKLNGYFPIYVVTVIIPVITTMQIPFCYRYITRWDYTVYNHILSSAIDIWPVRDVLIGAICNSVSLKQFSCSTLCIYVLFSLKHSTNITYNLRFRNKFFFRIFTESDHLIHGAPVFWLPVKTGVYRM